MHKNLLLFLLFFILSCSKATNVYDKNGFASLSINNEIISELPAGSLIKVINLDSKENVTIKTTKRVLSLNSRIISLPKKFFQKINLSSDLPFVRVISVRENNTFIAKRAKTYDEEKNINNKVSFNKIEIVNLSSQQASRKKIYLNYGPFYFQTYADGLFKVLKFNLKNEKILYKDYKEKNYIISVGPVNNLKEFDNLHKSLGALGLIGYEVMIK